MVYIFDSKLSKTMLCPVEVNRENYITIIENYISNLIHIFSEVYIILTLFKAKRYFIFMSPILSAK